MFEEVVNQLPLEINPKTLSLSMNESNIDYMSDRLFQLDKLSDEEVYHLVCKTYTYLLDEMFISKNMDKNSNAILNYDDELTKKLGQEKGLPIVFFDLRKRYGKDSISKYTADPIDFIYYLC